MGANRGPKNHHKSHMEDLKAAEGVTGSEKGGPNQGSKTGPLNNRNFEVFKTTRRDFWGGPTECAVPPGR